MLDFDGERRRPVLKTVGGRGGGGEGGEARGQGGEGKEGGTVGAGKAAHGRAMSV